MFTDARDTVSRGRKVTAVTTGVSYFCSTPTRRSELGQTLG